jgi:hypothetical protein
MGLSSSSYNQIEKELLETYTLLMSETTDGGKSEAKKVAKGMLNQAIEQSKAEGTYYLPQTFGDILLGDVVTDDPTINSVAKMIRQRIPKKKRAGVRDEDIRWFWNMNDIERRMMLIKDDMAIFASYMHVFKNPTEPAQSFEEASSNALARARKFHIQYGNPEDTTHTKGDDRPLPHELKYRVDIYIEKREKADGEKFIKEMGQSSTFNALLRREMRSGNL